LSLGKQALILIPEIALTVEFIDRLKKRFGEKPAQWHSGVTMTEKRRCWRMVGEDKAQVVVGARSSLYLPFKNLGLIVVDEEHDTSYKQEDGALYSARDMAVMRASIEMGAVILASATPSLETWANADGGKYNRIDLTERFGDAIMPEILTIDMRHQPMLKNSWISPQLKEEVDLRLERDEQSLLFLNRRGYAPITVCRKCGDQVGCEQCDARMVEHRFNGHLMCHQCGETKNIPNACPTCGEVDCLTAVGPGVERLAEEAQEKFPNAKISVLSSDMLISAQALKARIKGIASGEADIIIGTQLVAKGHNFPLLTLVGVIDSDLALMGGDLRAAERTFQLMRQVAGRAGRVDKKGTAFLQTHQPEHSVIKSVVLKRLEGRVEEIEGQNSNIISAAYKNISTTFRVHSAILEALEPKTFSEFLNFLKTDWANTLNIDTARLCLEAPSISQNDIPQLQMEFGPSVVFLQEGEIDHYITLGQDNDPRPVTLRQIRKGASNIYNDIAPELRSEALMKLDLGEGNSPGLLLLGSTNPDQFLPNMGTDLLVFYGSIFEKIMQRWLFNG
ncbi:primosomal protein N', partial [Amylibacter sp.]|nr:primosomal protein N' [Amylibacter sp.]